MHAPEKKQTSSHHMRIISLYQLGFSGLYQAKKKIGTDKQFFGSGTSLRGTSFLVRACHFKIHADQVFTNLEANQTVPTGHWMRPVFLVKKTMQNVAFVDCNCNIKKRNQNNKPHPIPWVHGQQSKKK